MGFLNNFAPIMKKLLVALFASLIVFVSDAQSQQQPSFVQLQRTVPKVDNAFKLKEDTLKKQFEADSLHWPPKQVYIRSFKYDSQLEVWVRDDDKEPFKLFKTYKVCALSGSLGPKRIEGDYQVPEGFYYINTFNPKSIFNLSLCLNYPNESDQVLSDSSKPGGGIYIHGGCVTVGCIPLMNNIDELYILATYAKDNGEDFIPVHVFPIRFTNAKSLDYLNKTTKTDVEYQTFVAKLKEVYDYFEKHKRLPIILVNKKGEYVIM